MSHCDKWLVAEGRYCDAEPAVFRMGQKRRCWRHNPLSRETSEIREYIQRRRLEFIAMEKRPDATRTDSVGTASEPPDSGEAIKKEE